MNIQNRRLEDLSKVVDRTWKANHNADIKNARIREKNFIDRIFNVKNKDSVDAPKIKTHEEKLNELQNNISSMRAFNDQNRNNRLRGKFN